MTVADVPEKEAVAAEQRRRPETATLALLTALVALASGALGLVFDLWPGLRPDPRSSHVGALSVFAVERGAKVADWLGQLPTDERAAERRYYLRTYFSGIGPATPAGVHTALASKGELFYVQVHIEGFKRETVALRWSMYSAVSQKRLTPSTITGDTAGGVVVGASPSDTSIVPVWGPQVPVAGPVFARFELLDAHDNILAVADSPRFPGLSAG
jgi:hypothetical protein